MKIDFFACSFFHVLHGFKRELYNIKNFHTHSEIYWENVGDDIQDSMNSELNDADKEDHESIVDAYVEELIYAKSISPNFHRETILVSLYNQVEFTLLRYCSLFNQEVMQQHDNFGKLSNRSALKNIADYLDNTCRFNSDSYKEEWQYLRCIKFIRNCLVHSNGIVLKNFDEIQTFCNENNHFNIRYNSIDIEKGAIDDFIGVLFRFFEKLDTEKDLFVRSYVAQYGAPEIPLPNGALAASGTSSGPQTNIKESP
ncbi:hypothetical protein [Rahnella sp. CJA17(1/100)]|uniref:hypothetical protein n=1 Tax=Rahnella sp. CJA17(1/100) TaxID=2508951 RepID=UPI00106F0B26|nr:hypothetical protein [Rahnella sp. CJA17(1/100)]